MSAGNLGAGFGGKQVLRGPVEAAHLVLGSIGLAKQLAHNLKAAGSNPAPATKKLRQNKHLEPDLNSQALSFEKRVNAVSTF